MNCPLKNTVILATTDGAFILLGICVVWGTALLLNERAKNKRLWDTLNARRGDAIFEAMHDFSTSNEDDYYIEHATRIQKYVTDATQAYIVANLTHLRSHTITKMSAYDTEVALLLYMEAYNAVAKTTSAETICENLHHIKSVEDGLKLFPSLVYATSEEYFAQMSLQKALNEVCRYRGHAQIALMK